MPVPGTVTKLEHKASAFVRYGLAQHNSGFAHLGTTNQAPGQYLRNHKQTDQPTPSKQLERQIVPQGNEGEDNQCIAQHVGCASQWDIDIPEKFSLVW